MAGSVTKVMPPTTPAKAANPQREHRGQPKIVVKQDDNLWNLARQYNQDFNRLLAANPHLLDPNVIFKGDSVYLPGR